MSNTINFGIIAMSMAACCGILIGYVWAEVRRARDLKRHLRELNELIELFGDNDNEEPER